MKYFPMNSIGPESAFRAVKKSISPNAKWKPKHRHVICQVVRAPFKKKDRAQ
jgi:hypothetical protein